MSNAIGKVQVNRILNDDTSGDPIENLVGPAQATLNITRYENASIQAIYAPGATNTIELQGSNLPDANFATIPDTDEVMDILGGSVLYNIQGMNFIYLRVVMPGAVATTCRFVGIDLQSN